MADLAAGEAVVEGPVYVRVRGLLRAVDSVGLKWFAQVRFASIAGPYAWQAVCVPIAEVMVVDAGAQHIPLKPPPA